MVGTNKQSPADDATYLRKVNITSYENIVRLWKLWGLILKWYCKFIVRPKKQQHYKHKK